MKVKSIEKNLSSENIDPSGGILRRSALAAAVSFCAMQAISPVQAAYDSNSVAIGDLSIYKPKAERGANVMMMLDVSGSMGVSRYTGTQAVATDSINDDAGFSCVSNGETTRVYVTGGGYYNAPKWLDRNGLGSFTESVTIEGETISYQLLGCTPGDWGTESSTAVLGDLYVLRRGRYVLDSTRHFDENASGDYYKYDNGNFYRIDGDYNPRKHTRYTINESWILGNPANWTWNSSEGMYVAANSSVRINDGIRLDRISRLKRALIGALGTYTADEISNMPPSARPGYAIGSNGKEVTVGDYKIPSDSLVGIGQFSAGDSNNRDGRTGQILVAAQELTPEHRKKLIRTIMSFSAGNGTPSANAYAEAGAYMKGTNTSGHSSSGFSNPVSVQEDTNNVKNSSNYVKPGSDDKYQCYGKGIYFLTDGYPNSAAGDTANMMRDTLGLDATTFSDLMGLSVSGTQAGSPSGWDEIGKYAQALRNYENPNEDIKTATVGYGRAFDDLRAFNTLTIVNDKGESETIVDCDAATGVNQDAINLCKWGMKEDYSDAIGTGVLKTPSDKKWGGGGFTPAQTSKEVADSLIAFIGVSEGFGDSTPGGTISVPKDSFRGGNTMPYAYLPMIKAASDDGKTIWQGNLKKYETKDGTLFGKGNERLFTSLQIGADGKIDRGGELREQAIDLWSPSTTGTGNLNIDSGGFYARLRAPDTSDVDSTRRVFVESYGSGSANGIARVQVSGGSAVGFDGLTDTVYGTTAEEKNTSDKILLNFLGYNVDPFDTALAAEGADDLDLNDYAPASGIRNVGGVIHSNPVLVSFSADVDDLGQVSTEADKRDEYLLFGSMDGTVHLVDAETGEEQWALVLKEMFRRQANALVTGSSGSLKFGVDAPWVVSAKYNYTEASGSDSAKVKLFDRSDFSDPDNADAVENTANFLPIAAYGGFRLGGYGLYGIEPYLGNDSGKQPRILFSITADANNDTPVLHNSNGEVVVGPASDYSNVGNIWSRVTLGRVFKTSSSTKPHDVIIFGGGYDERYEDPQFVPSDDRSTDPTKGSSLYIADAKDGKILRTAVAGSTDPGIVWTNPYNHSIVGGITTLDRNADGYFDYMYFADMGGNVFRAAVVNEEGQDFEVVSVARVFGASDELLATLPEEKHHLAYRFYNRPVVSFYTDEEEDLFAVVNVASGNRSSPLSKEREDQKYANKVYGIIDRQIATGELLTKGPDDEYPSGSSLTTLTQTNLTKLGKSELDGKSESSDTALNSFLCPEDTAACRSKVSLVAPMVNSNDNTGWYYPLTRFDGYEGVKNVKAFGDYRVINGTLYMSAYESDLKFEDVNACDGDIKGVTENQLYCLPYGVCMEDSSVTGTGGYVGVSRGIQELTLGALDADNTDKTTLIGTSTIQEKQAAAVAYNEDGKKGNKAMECKADTDCDGSRLYSNWPDAGQLGGDGSAKVEINTSRFVLVPQRWYELNQKND